MGAVAPWWRGAVIYQVYIRSFADANGDGQGDLAGLRSKLGYLAGLGVDALWLSPIHPSPNRDWGYDVADYEGVHPDYGTDEDFDHLLAEAHALGLKVMLDEVLAHTSDEHPWFLDSLKGGDRADWYVWADPQLDGTVPNNWLSAFAGPAWAYQPARRQYYHHKFLRQQPKLNWHNKDTRAAALAVLDHWLARGVDGFRLDVANAFLHDPSLRDNPPLPMAKRTAQSWAHAPNLQIHHHDSNLAENVAVLDEIRHVVERYPNRFVMGEFSEEAARCGCYAPADKGLHSGYSFPLLEAHTLGPAFIREHYAMLTAYTGHWPSIAFSNHDVMRTVSRFGGKEPPQGLAKLMFALLLSLRGTALIYQGEELGLPQAHVGRSDLKDPVGDLYYPYIYGRDGCRTPMPWDDVMSNLGFTSGEPWLPMGKGYAALAVSRQLAAPDSNLSFARRFLVARKASAALRWGDIDFVDAPEAILAFVRTYEGERVFCLFNMSGGDVHIENTSIGSGVTLGIGCGRATANGSAVRLGPYAAEFIRF